MLEGFSIDNAVNWGQVANVVNAYEAFWNKKKFKLSPHLQPKHSFASMRPFLASAAELVVRIRAHLDTINPGLKVRQLDGSADEFLFQARTWMNPSNPKEVQQKFVSELLHATLKDRNGYVEGLRADEIDKVFQAFWKQREPNIRIVASKASSTCASSRPLAARVFATESGPPSLALHSNAATSRSQQLAQEQTADRSMERSTSTNKSDKSNTRRKRDNNDDLEEAASVTKKTKTSNDKSGWCIIL